MLLNLDNWIALCYVVCNKSNYQMKHLESDIIADMTRKTGFRNLLKSYGFKSVRVSKREQHVSNGGLNRTRGRLDLVYTTDVGKVIVEVQRGKSDNDHYERFSGYLSNFAEGQCVGLVWVAEEFTDMHIYMCQTSDNPILPVEAKWNGKKWEYTAMLNMVECFGSYNMAYVNHTISCHNPLNEENFWKPPVKTLESAFAERNPIAGHLVRLLSSDKIYANGVTPFEVHFYTSETKVSAATLHRLHIALS